MATVNHSKSVARKPSESARHQLQALANLLEQDILRRGLRAGDRYVTSQEAARMLEVSTGKVHQVMRYLVDKKVLDRRRKQGTFVGRGARPAENGIRPKIYVLTPAEGARDSSYSRWAHEIFPAVSKACNGASLQLEYLPSNDPLGFVRSLIEREDQQASFTGFVLLRSTYELQEFFQENVKRYSTVVWGDVFPGIDRLPCISHDQYEIGKQCIDYIVRKGHKRVSMIMLDSWAAGDNNLMRGIHDAMDSAKQNIDHFEMFGLPLQNNALRSHIHGLLTAKKRPEVIIARMSAQISMVYEVARELGLNVPQDVEVMLAGNALTTHPVTHWVPKQSVDKVCEILCSVLVALHDGKELENNNSTLPVQIVEF